MSNVAASVTVVTTTSDEGVHAGLTVSAFSAVSLDPPLVLVCIGKESASVDALLANRGFTVNFLTRGADAVAMQLASRDDDKFAGLELHHPSVAGAGPVLAENTFAFFACTTTTEVEAGDHWILVGLVEEAAVNEDPEPPLVYHRRLFLPLDV